MPVHGDLFLGEVPQRSLAQCAQGERLPGLWGTGSPAGSRAGAHVRTRGGGVMCAHTCPLWGWEQLTGDEVQGPAKDPQVRNLTHCVENSHRYQFLSSDSKSLLLENANMHPAAPVWLNVSTVSVIKLPGGFVFVCLAD